MSQIFLESGRVVPVTIIRTSQDIDTAIENKQVYIVGTSKGKGFTGVMKRWGYHGEMATRGQSTKPRSGGSIGSQTPGRVRKGKKMAGRLGTARVTIKGLKIVRVLPEKKELMVSGPIPGHRNSAVVVKII